MQMSQNDESQQRYSIPGLPNIIAFFCLLQVNTGDKMWDYMLGKFIHDSYAGEWYNRQFEPTTEYIGNTASMLIGMPRLRQLRINEGICRFHAFHHVCNERSGMLSH